jgi:hypothetical protein
MSIGITTTWCSMKIEDFHTYEAAENEIARFVIIIIEVFRI